MIPFPVVIGPVLVPTQALLVLYWYLLKLSWSWYLLKLESYTGAYLGLFLPAGPGEDLAHSVPEY